jgi:septum formation protein
VSLILASGSPQRRAILERLGVSFTVSVPEVVELEQGTPEVLAVENARRKATAVGRTADGEVVLGCDTVVSLDGVIYGKPVGEEDARRTLRTLAGRTHDVVSGLVLLVPGGERTAVARTEVSFRPLTEAMIDWYLAGGEWRGRAGGYAIQGAGAALVSVVAGDYENVVGLPLAALLDVYPELLGH